MKRPTATRSGSSATPIPTSSKGLPPVAAPTLQPIELRQLLICSHDCAVTGSVRVNHPSWGTIWILTAKTGGIEEKAPWLSYESVVVAIDGARSVRWKRMGGDWGILQPAAPETDHTGNIFLKYNAGRDNGLLILTPTKNGIDDLGTIPSDPELTAPRFDSSQLIDIDGDGVQEIRQSYNQCNPTCAESNYVTKVYRWNRKDYAPE